MSLFHKKLSGARWERVRRDVLDRDGWRCTRCGLPGALEVHHVRELHHGGDPWAHSNLITLCRDCHIEGHRTPPIPGMAEWADYLKSL